MSAASNDYLEFKTSFSVSPVRVKEGWILVDNKLVQVHDLAMELEENWYNIGIDANGKVVQLIDWVSDAKYRVYPLGM